jgi:DNA gyrase/topoisomerase IV subunit A
MKLRISNNKIDVQLPPQELEHSLMFSLFYSDTIKENIEAETQRIKVDLEALEGLIAQDFEQIINIVRISKGAKDLQEKLAKQHHLNEFQVAFIANLKLDEWLSLDFMEIKRNLQKSLRFLEILIGEK